jgi:hypothetical protein
VARANANDPNLSVGVTGFEAIASCNFAPIDFKISGFNVDRDDFPVIALRDLRTHLRFINLITTLSKFLFAVSGLALSGVEVLSNCHQPILVSTEPFYFNVN